MIDYHVVSELRSLARPDEPVLAEMVRVYFERASALMQQLTSALAARDLPRLQHCADALARCSRRVGARELSDSSRALEHAEPDWHELATRIRVLDWELREVQLALMALPEVGREMRATG